MKPFTLREVVEAVGGRYFGPEDALDRPVTAVLSDSRAVEPGTLFVAFKGARADGHDFMASCLARGAVACLSEREPAGEAETPCVAVDSTLSAVGALAAWYRRGFDIPVVGITGSVGKTTTKEMISAVLSKHYRTHKTQKNFNNELGVPRTLLSLPEDAQVAVVEMGISGFGEMTRLTNMVRPNIAVISVIGDAHLEFLGDRAGVLRAKTEIFGSMGADGLAVLNGDDEYLRHYQPPVRKITYGLEKHNDFVAEDIRNLGGEGMRFAICHHGERFEAYVPAFGVHMVYAALAAAVVGNALGVSDAEIAAGIADYMTVGNRARLIDTGRIRILSDCYNANPNSVAAAIDSMATLPGRKVCILGDMLELGENTVRMHRDTGSYAARRGVELVLGAGRLSEATCEGAREGGCAARWFESREALIAALDGLIREGDCVLVKASHSCAFETVAEALEARYRA